MLINLDCGKLTSELKLILLFLLQFSSLEDMRFMEKWDSLEKRANPINRDFFEALSQCMIYASPVDRCINVFVCRIHHVFQN